MQFNWLFIEVNSLLFALHMGRLLNCIELGSQAYYQAHKGTGENGTEKFVFVSQSLMGDVRNVSHRNSK